MKKVQSVPNMEDLPQKRNLARNALLAVGARAETLTSTIKSSSVVFKFGIETAGRILSPATSFTLSQWSHYGEPLLSQLDEKLDSTLDAIQGATRTDEKSENDHSYVVFWDALKEKLFKTKWFGKVNEILLQNSLVQAVSAKLSPLVHPAEVFFNTATEVFLSDGGSWDSFIEVLKTRLGPAWDDRLTHPARAFYTTSRAVKTLVGAGKFFGGVVQLGRQKLNQTLDELISRWDSMVLRTDNAVDYLLPDRDPNNVENLVEEHIETDTDIDESADNVLRDTSDAFGVPSVPDSHPTSMEVDSVEVADATDAHDEASSCSSSSSSSPVPLSTVSGTKRPRSMIPIAHKVSKRLRQRIPLVTDLPTQLKSRLMQSEWFQRVDEILRENVVVQMMQLQMMAVSALSQVVRPAEHFYNTAASAFVENAKSCQDFLVQLRQAMGRAWDERLALHAVAFFKSASRLIAQQEASCNQVDAVADIAAPSAQAPAQAIC